MTELNFDNLKDVPRLLMEVELEPVQGSRFQPTGFPDLGAAVYERPDGKRMILLESAQSMANRLEQVCLDGNGPDIAKDLAGLPYVRVKLTGDGIDSVTSSLVEAHRINSPFIMHKYHGEFQKKFIEKAGYGFGKQINWKKIGETLFFYDTNSILHGAFMVNLEFEVKGEGKTKKEKDTGSRIKVPRALTGFIEAEDIREATSGGVKNSLIDPSGKIITQGDKRDVYSNVPYHRMEYTAGKITAYFNFDLALINGFGFDPEAKNLLVALALYKIRRFLQTGLRLRTACDLKVKEDIQVTVPEKFTIPTEMDLLDTIKKKIQKCSEKGLIVQPPVTELTTNVEIKSKQDKRTGEPTSEDEYSAAGSDDDPGSE